MKEKTLKIDLQTFFVSKEISRCPLIPEILHMSTKLSNSKTYEKNRWTMSVRYGKRMIIASRGSNIKNLQREDFVEVVDCNPVKKTALVIGGNEPGHDTVLHWLIYRAREEVNAVVHIQNASKEITYVTLERALEILKVLKKDDYIMLKNNELLVVGIDLKHVEDKILKISGEYK